MEGIRAESIKQDLELESALFPGRRGRGSFRGRRRGQGRKFQSQSDRAAWQALKAKENRDRQLLENAQKRSGGERNFRQPTSSKKSRKITPAGDWLRRIGSVAGTFLGNQQLGFNVGAGISRIFGQGDYTIKSNSLMSGGAPSFAALNTGIRMAHREYVGDVLSSIDYKNQTYQITPTNRQLFPWLSNVAQNFEEYSFRGLVFYFNTTSGSAISSTNNALGVVGATTVYDPTDADLASKREAEDYGGCVSGVPSCSFLHPVECKPQSNVLDRLYVQASATITNPEDWKFYSLGKLNVFTQGMQQAGVTIGELWVSYDIEFFTPKILPIGTNQLAGGRIPFGSFETTSITNPFGTDKTSILGNIAIKTSGQNITIPQGTATGHYLVLVQQIVEVAATYVLNTSVSPNLQIVWAGTAPNLSAANIWHETAVVVYKSDANAATLTVVPTSGYSTSSTTEIYVVKIPSSMFGFQEFKKKDVVDRDYVDSMFNKLLKQIKPEFNQIDEVELEEEVESPEQILLPVDQLQAHLKAWARGKSVL